MQHSVSQRDVNILPTTIFQRLSRYKTIIYPIPLSDEPNNPKIDRLLLKRSTVVRFPVIKLKTKLGIHSASLLDVQQLVKPLLCVVHRIKMT